MCIKEPEYPFKGWLLETRTLKILKARDILTCEPLNCRTVPLVILDYYILSRSLSIMVIHRPISVHTACITKHNKPRLPVSWDSTY